MICIDFETYGIDGHEPPVPVGVALVRAGEKARYYAWGHPSGNNCAWERASIALHMAWKSKQPLLFHNAKFDLKVAQAHFGLPIPSWDRVHDTMFLAFLDDPHNTSSLKETAERVLDMPPEERDAVREWLIEHRVIPRKAGKNTFGKNIWQAPGDVVGAYAIGDVERTVALFNALLPRIEKAGMRAAYDRERRLLPILIENERTGMRLDVERLESDLPRAEATLVMADEWLRDRLRAPSLNVDAADELAAALRKSKSVKIFPKTPTGKDSISKKSLTLGMFSDRTVGEMMRYRGALATILENSMRPWLTQAKASKGRIFTEWNQVKAVDNGTRSGRLSCSRFQNIAKSFEGMVTPKGFAPLPLVRTYLLPDTRGEWVHRDYNQQEFRILAHFEGEDLQQGYVNEPRMDYHTKMQVLIENIAGLKLERRPVKILNFGINYGMGIGKLAGQLGFADKYGCPPECNHKLCEAGREAKKLRDAQRRAVPGINWLNDTLKRRAQDGQPIRTWGGRLYYCEPPLMSGSTVIQTYEYKMLNYLIQGSAADMTKSAIIAYYDHPKRAGRMLVTVHDEINVSVDKRKWREESEVLREAMESVQCDVPMLTDAKVGRSWGEIKSYE